MSSSDGFGGGPYEHLLAQGASGFTPENLNMHTFQQEAENGLSKKKRNKNRSSGTNASSLTLPSGSKTVDKSSGFLPKNGRKGSGQLHNNNDQQTRRSSQSEYELLCEKEDLDNRASTEFNGNFNGLHSPRGTAAVWNGKQDNTKAVPDPSSIVERLMHLRDCIKQVTSIMHSLEKTDEPVTGKQMNSLNQMLQMMRKEEQEHMERLQQVLACREETEKTKAPAVAQREVPPLQTPATGNRRRNNESAFLESMEMESDEPQNELLLRMLDSQKKFASIREQQASLLMLQKQAEEKLAAARAFHEHFVQCAFSSEGVTRSISSNLSTSSAGSSTSSGVERGASQSNHLLLHEQEGCEDDTSEAALVVTNNAEDLDDDILAGIRPPLVPPRKEESLSSAAFDLDEIQKRISALRELHLDRQVQCEQLDQNGGLASGNGRLASSAEAVSRDQAQKAANRQRQHLEGKLRQLQEKKQQMNTLLAELSNLHTCTQSGSEEQLDLPSVSPVSYPSPVNSSLQQAKVAADIGEAQRKLKQLEEMKNTLRTLQRLTENIEQADNSLNKDEGTPPPPPPPLRGRSQSHSESGRSLASLKPDNIRRDCPAAASAQFPARRHYEAEGRANEDADAVQNVSTIVAAAVQNPASIISVATSSNGSVSNGNGSSRSGSAAGDSRIIDHKVQELADAESKLKKLKSLLSAMQQGVQDGEEPPYSSALLASLPADLGANSSASPVINNGDLGEDSEDSGVSADQAKAGQEEFEIVMEHGKSKQQLKRDMEMLLRERKRLATMQQQLSTLQLQFGTATSALPPNVIATATTSNDGLNNSRDRSSGEGGSMLKARGTQLSHSFTSNEMGRQDNRYRENAVLRSEAKTLNSHANNVQQSKSRGKARASSADYVDTSTNHLNRNHNNNNNSQPNSSFSDLSDQLDYNLALRDELRAQKAVLQELLNQERSKQMGFSQNQDTQSHSESSGKTEKSEVVSIPCPSSAIPSLDQETTNASHWGLLGNSLEEGPTYSISDNLQAFEDQQQSIFQF